jgi:LPXTG-motif cell wall-anchored protein
MSARSIECAVVPSVCRRIVALLVVACLGAVAHVSPALAQDAGDQQYSDPFGNSGTSTTQSTPKTQTTPSGNLEPLSPSPQQSAGTGSTGAAPATTPSTAGQAAPAAAAQGLPNTGADTRVLLLAGAALLLTGLGLRLRSAPERF